jgi:hypothetical protein
MAGKKPAPDGQGKLKNAVWDANLTWLKQKSLLVSPA